VTLPSSEELDATVSGLRPIPFQPIPEGQCLRDAFACCLRVPSHWLPERLEHEHVEDWFSSVKSRFALELRYLHPELDELPPTRDEPWIAIVTAPIAEGMTHALVVRGWRIVFDPGGWRTGGLLDPSEVRAALGIIGAHGEVVSA
jgi:hypothetical protein